MSHTKLATLVLIAFIAPQTSAQTGTDHAVERGLDFLRARGADIEPATALTLDYLDRRFGVSQVEALIGAARGARETDYMPSLMRLVGESPNIDIPAYLAGDIGPWQRMMVRALYCDAHPPPSGYAEELSDAVLVGQYHLTHSALATQWLVGLGCVTERDISELRLRQHEALVALLSSGLAATDMGMEAVAGLYHTGGGALVEPEWLDAIVAAQRPDGGWASRPGLGESTDHATMLAIWALLAAGGQGTANQPMIPDAVVVEPASPPQQQ